jgi:hypothetical protein
MLMGHGYALTEEFRCEAGYPKSKFGTIVLPPRYGARSWRSPSPAPR